MEEPSVVWRAGADADLERWFTNPSRGSPITAEVYQKRLRRTYELLDTPAKGLVEHAESGVKGLYDAFEDLVTRLEAEQKSPGWVYTFSPYYICQ